MPPWLTVTVMAVVFTALGLVGAFPGVRSLRTRTGDDTRLPKRLEAAALIAFGSWMVCAGLGMVALVAQVGSPILPAVLFAAPLAVGGGLLGAAALVQRREEREASQRDAELERPVMPHLCSVWVIWTCWGVGTFVATLGALILIFWLTWPRDDESHAITTMIVVLSLGFVGGLAHTSHQKLRRHRAAQQLQPPEQREPTDLATLFGPDLAPDIRRLREHLRAAAHRRRTPRPVKQPRNDDAS